MESARPLIVVLGSINMDLVIRCDRLPSPGETVLADSCAEVPGGKGANQAVAAARVGGDVAMIGCVGDDAFATRLLKNLQTENVDSDAVRLVKSCPSGVAVVAVDEQGENSIIVVAGANAELKPNDVQRHADLIRRSSLLLMQLEVPLATIAAAAKLAHDAGVRVILDPAPMAVSADALPRVDLLCPNRSEAEAIVGHSISSLDDAHKAATAIHERYACDVILTLGSEGAVVCDSEGTESLAPFSVAAVDTTAAGDAFAGALAVRLAHGDALRQAARYASAAGAIAATRHGAQPGMPSAKEIEQLLG